MAASAGGHHTLAVTRSGRLYAWGRDFSGQLGRGPRDPAAGGAADSEYAAVPVRIAFSKDAGAAEQAAMVAAGQCHSVLITSLGAADADEPDLAAEVLPAAASGKRVPSAKGKSGARRGPAAADAKQTAVPPGPAAAAAAAASAAAAAAASAAAAPGKSGEDVGKPGSAGSGAGTRDGGDGKEAKKRVFLSLVVEVSDPSHGASLAAVTARASPLSARDSGSPLSAREDRKKGKRRERNGAEGTPRRGIAPYRAGSAGGFRPEPACEGPARHIGPLLQGAAAEERHGPQVREGPRGPGPGPLRVADSCGVAVPLCARHTIASQARSDPRRPRQGLPPRLWC